MNRRCALTCSVAAILMIFTAVSWGGKVQTPQKPGSDEVERVSKHPAARQTAETPEPQPEQEQSTPPKPRIIGEPLISADGRRVYYPYVPPPRWYPPYPRHQFYPYRDDTQPPVLFFNDMLDMALVWDRYQQRFRWEPIVPPRPYAAPARSPAGRAAEGQPEREAVELRRVEPEAAPAYVPATTTAGVGEVVRAVLSPTGPRIVARVNDEEKTYEIAKDAVILRGQVGERAAEAKLAEIRAGDRVTLRFTGEGTVDTIRAQYNTVSGKVEAVAKATVLLETGETFKVTSETQVTLPGDVKGKAEDIRPGDTIRAEASPVSGAAYLVEVMSAGRDEEAPTKEAQEPKADP